MNEAIYAIGDFFEVTFGILEMMKGVPGDVCLLLGFVGLGYWLNTQKKLIKKNTEEGTLV